MTGDDPLPRTLGAVLDTQGRRLAARRLTTLPWAGPLRVFMDHAAGLAGRADRFDRIEHGADRRIEHGAGRRAGYGAGRGAPRPPAADGSRPRLGDGPRDTAPPAPAAPGPPRPGPATTHQRPPETDVPPEAGRALPAPVGSRLRAALGPAADGLRVHDDDRSDALARRQGADAVTVGREVFFRHGRLRPAEPAGFGLLAHEATHVLALLRPGASWRRATGGGVREEEAEALANERAVTFGGGPHAALPAAGRPAAELPAPAATPLPAAAPAPVPTPLAHPQRAPADRHTGVAQTAPAPVDLQALRRHVIDDVMRRLRSEFERGG